MMINNLQYRGWLLLLLALYPLLCGFDINNLTENEALEWSNAIHTELEHLQSVTPPEQRNAYYWYIYGILKQSSYFSKMRFTKFIAERLPPAFPACDELYADDRAKAEECRRRLNGLMPDEFFKDR